MRVCGMNQPKTSGTIIKVFSKGMEKRDYVQGKFRGKDLHNLETEWIWKEKYRMTCWFLFWVFCVDINWETGNIGGIEENKTGLELAMPVENPEIDGKKRE